MNSIILAGGCFWGVQHYFKQVKGVMKTIVGYTAGEVKFPTYEIICTGASGHAEACKVEYDSSITNLNILLTHFFNIIDPTLLNQQAGDIGPQYRTGIYYNDQSEYEIIKKFIDSIKNDYTSDILVEVLQVTEFWEAEEYHQDYLDKDEYGYCHIPIDKYKLIEKIDAEARKKYLF